jgi:hypothetical protein
MEMRTLLPLFTASGTLNVVLMIIIFILAYKNMKLGQREYYRPFIMIFVTLAYLIRIAEFIYLALV